MRKLPTMFAAVALAVVLPLVGVFFAGRPMSAYLEFPPLTRYVDHEGFSLVAFVLLAAYLLVTVIPFVIRSINGRESKRPADCFAKPWLPFPWWGWFGLVCGMFFWVLAWNRFVWVERMQGYLFGPQWLAYILVVNAWTYKRSGRCMMISRPGIFAGLFALSAAFWWYFEYLNRFVQNWYYVGIGGLSSLDYFLFATIPFSTVLPAVLGTYELLMTVPRLGAGLDDFVKIRIRRVRALAAATLAVSSFGLAGLGLWPDYLFPLLWISPLLIVTSLKTMAGVDTIFAPVREGRWRNICLLALASLICGGFWEMWNFYSLAKWIYAVPFIGEFKIFEMPVLGFSGYLPFGIECAAIAELVGFQASPSPRSLARAT